MKPAPISRTAGRWIIAGLLAAASVAVVSVCRRASGSEPASSGESRMVTALKKVRCASAEARLKRLQGRNPYLDPVIRAEAPAGCWDRYAALK